MPCGESVVHQQDCLLSCQLRPTFPPAWKECGAVRLQVDTVPSGYRLLNRANGLGQNPDSSHGFWPQPIRGLPTIEPGTF